MIIMNLRPLEFKSEYFVQTLFILTIGSNTHIYSVILSILNILVASP